MIKGVVIFFGSRAGPFFLDGGVVHKQGDEIILNSDWDLLLKQQVVTYPPPKFNIALENRESQKGTHLPTIHFQGRAVKLPGGRSLLELKIHCKKPLKPNDSGVTRPIPLLLKVSLFPSKHQPATWRPSSMKTTQQFQHPAGDQPSRPTTIARSSLLSQI